MEKQTIRVPENVKLTFDNDIEGCRVLIIEAVKEISKVNKGFKGKLMAEEPEPLFTNSHGTKFYDSGFRVDKDSLQIIEDKLSDVYEKSYSGSQQLTEFLTKEQAEQYVLDNRVFEDETYYKAVYKNKNTCAWYSAYLNHFYLSTHTEIIKRTDFDSIGDKIEF